MTCTLEMRRRWMYSPILLRRSILRRHLIPQLMVLPLQAFDLLLQHRHIPILGLELLLQPRHLVLVSTLGNLLPQQLHFILQAQHLEYHDVRTVQDQRQEQREAAQVHVALGVEAAGLDLHALGAEGGGGSAIDVS